MKTNLKVVFILKLWYYVMLYYSLIDNMNIVNIMFGIKRENDVCDRNRVEDCFRQLINCTTTTTYAL